DRQPKEPQIKVLQVAKERLQHRTSGVMKLDQVEAGAEEPPGGRRQHDRAGRVALELMETRPQLIEERPGDGVRWRAVEPQFEDRVAADGLDKGSGHEARF